MLEVRAVLKGIYNRLETHDRSELLKGPDYIESQLRNSFHPLHRLTQPVPVVSGPFRSSRQGKVRINELARELEIKAHEILDRLPELGVTEKKTHSSSIDQTIAKRLRTMYGAESEEEQQSPSEVPQDQTVALAMIDGRIRLLRVPPSRALG